MDPDKLLELVKKLQFENAKLTVQARYPEKRVVVAVVNGMEVEV